MERFALHNLGKTNILDLKFVTVTCFGKVGLPKPKENKCFGIKHKTEEIIFSGKQHNQIQMNKHK